MIRLEHPGFHWFALALAPLVMGASFAAAVAGCAVGVIPVGDGEGEGEGEGEGGGEPCGDDPVLGGLALGPAAVLVASAAVTAPVGIAGIAAVPAGGSADSSPRLLALTDDLLVVDLGQLTDLRATPEELFDALGPGDEALAPWSEAFPSFIVGTAEGVATGYTRLDFGGFVGVHETAGLTSTFIDAPLNFAAAALGANLFVNGDGLDSLAGKLGVHTQEAGVPRTVAVLGASAIASGFMAATPEGTLVAGRFTDTNALYAIPPVALAQARAGTPIDLEEQTPIHSGSLGGVAGVTGGVALLEIDDSYRGIAVSALAVDDAGVAGARTPLLAPAGAACTTVSFLAPWQGDVIVGVLDERGLRVVQLRRG